MGLIRLSARFYDECLHNLLFIRILWLAKQNKNKCHKKKTRKHLDTHKRNICDDSVFIYFPVGRYIYSYFYYEISILHLNYTLVASIHRMEHVQKTHLLTPPTTAQTKP